MVFTKAQPDRQRYQKGIETIPGVLHMSKGKHCLLELTISPTLDFVYAINIMMRPESAY
ncbi:MAG: hypothetical protein ACRDCT_30315 [Shewanella sp.]